MRSLVIIFLFLYQFVIAGETPQRLRTDANIFGHVVDAKTGEHLPFINMIIKGTRMGTMTDASGHYILANLPPGEHILIVSALGYRQAQVSFEAVAGKSRELNISLEPEAVELQEVVLSASPTASGFRYRPDAVLLGEMLQRKSEVSFGEILNGQAGLAMRSMGSAPGRPVIRGLGGDRMLMLENGERMGDVAETSADHAISLDPMAASRIEIVRGPAGLLYGPSALGGVVNVLTSDIPDQQGGQSGGMIALHGASVNRMGAAFGRYTLARNNSAYTARLALRRGGNIRTPQGELPGTSLNNLDASAGWATENQYGTGGLSISANSQQYEIPDKIDIEGERVEIRTNRQNLQGRWNGNTERFFDRYQLRLNVVNFGQHEVEISEPPATGQYQETVGLSYNQTGMSSTMTMQHKAFSFFDRGAVGMNVQMRRLNISGGKAFTPGEIRHNAGLFTFQEIPLSNKFRLQAGLRADLQYLRALPNDRFSKADDERLKLNFTGAFGFNHRPLEGWEIGAQFARSHRNPSITELYANGPHVGAGTYEIGNPNLRDEVGHGADMFIRFERKAHKAEIALFLNYFRNFISFEPMGVIDPATGYPIFSYQGREARLTGGEFQYSTLLTNGLELALVADYVHGAMRPDQPGWQPLPGIPPFRFSAALDYEHKFWWIGLKMQSAATQDRVAPDEDVTTGYTLLGWHGGIRMNKAGRHVVGLRLDNALNTSYRDHLSQVENRGFPMPGRNFSVTYRWYF
ncbi:MAG TPA: TonB-dependent receptor [Bacteroidales bacterium]|nr:TonB-dependent receptor [Bacteroidales bacterium]